MTDALAALRPAVLRHPMPPRDGDRPKGLNALGLLALHPVLARAYNTFNGHLLFGTTLTARQRELLILRVAHLRDSPYEWAQHMVAADDADITAEEIERVTEGGAARGWSDLDGALLGAVDELVTDARIAEPTWEVLAADLDQEQLMDLVFTVGAYDLLAMAFRSFDLELDADLRKWYSPE